MMNRVLIFLFSFIVIISAQQAFAVPEIEDEVIVGFDSEVKVIPDWVKTTMGYYLNNQISEREILDAFNWLFENNIMHLSEEAALEVQQMRKQISDLKQELQETKASPNLLEARKGANESSSDQSGEFWFTGLEPGYYERESGERIMQPEFGSGLSESKVVVRGWDMEQKESTELQDNNAVQRFVLEVYAESVSLPDGLFWYPLKEGDVLVTFEKGDPDRPIIVGRIFNESTSSSQIQPSQTKVLVSDSDFGQASEMVNEVLRKGGTHSAWEEGIASLPTESTDSVVDELQRIVVLCNNAIDKETQQIDAELKIMSQWLKIISERQEDISLDAYERTEGTSVSQHNQSDLDFIARNLSSIDQQIKALSTGNQVLEEKLQSMGEDAQLANIDLQNSLQKQQQTLQTLSENSKAAHDTAMSIIRKIG